MLANTFERVYVVNLPRRSDRWERFLESFPKNWPFAQPIRYSALDGGLVRPPAWWKDGNGAWGCYRTHVQILEECLNEQVDSVLILEDDAACVSDFVTKSAEFMQHLPDDWNMVYLGGQHLEENKRLPRKVNDWVYRPYNVNRTHCYGLRGREMMITIYRHLHDFASWKVAHHIDHYLGEMHKKTKTGLYVPREWLVKQAAGESDVCNKSVESKLFLGAKELIEPSVDLQGVALLGSYFSGTNTIAGALHRLGVHLGNGMNIPDDAKQTPFYEDPWLSAKCRNCYAEPWLTDKLDSEDRMNHLRHWAGVQCRYRKDGMTIFCGKHPILSLMGEELYHAWNKPKFISVDRSDTECAETIRQAAWGWHPDAIVYALKRLREVRERFFETFSPPLLRVDYTNAVAEPEDTVDSLCRFLELNPTPEQREKAIALLRDSKNDLFTHTKNDMQ